LLFPWSIRSNNSIIPAISIEESTVGYYQTNTCDFSLQEILSNNFNNKIEILPDKNSSVKCFGKINGVDNFSDSIKVYVGTNMNVDFLLQSLFFLLLVSTIPKSENSKNNYLPLISILFFCGLLYVHLEGERMFYEYFSKNFNLNFTVDNYFLLSLFLICILTLIIFNDLMKDRFSNFLNYLPFMFLFVGTYNTLNINIFVLFIAFIGFKSFFENKYNKKIFLVYLVVSIIQIFNFKESVLLFDIDKLKGFVNSSQTIESLIFWIIVYYFLISGILYLINESKEFFNFSLFIKNLLISGTIITAISFLSALNPFLNFITYYYLGLNKAGIKSFNSVEGNTWRGIGSSAEALGEFYGFVILITSLGILAKKIKLNKITLLLLVVNFYGLYETNNFAALLTLFLLISFYVLISLKLVNRFSIITITLIITVFVSLLASTVSYDLYSEALLSEGYIATDLNIELPKDQYNNTAVENSNFGEILQYPKDQTNISNSLYLFTERYTSVKNIKYIPNEIAVVSFIAKTINRSEKWGVFLAKYNPNLGNFLFGHGPNQLSEYYLGHKTKVNTGLVLPHSSFLDFLIFYGLFGLLFIIFIISRILYINRKNYLYLILNSYLLINFIKSDSILYVASFTLFIFIINFYKIENESTNSNE